MSESSTFDTDVAIVGAGIWGLSAAHFLRGEAPGTRLTVVDAAEVPGGAIQTVRRGDYLFEPGPNSLLDNSPGLRRLLAETGLEERVVEARPVAARSRYIVRGGRLRRLPMSPPAFLKTDLFSWRAKLRLLREPFIGPSDPDSEPTLEQFVLRRLGREFLDYAIDPFVSGTFAGVPEELSVRDAFRRLWELEQAHGSLIKGAMAKAKQRKRDAAASGGDAADDGAVQAGPSGKMLTFPQGLQTLVDTLAEPLGQDLRLGARLREVRRAGDGFRLAFDGAVPFTLTARSVLLTVPAWLYQDLHFDFPVPDEALAGIPYPPVVAVFFGYDQHPLPDPPEGFGFLVPRVEQRRILGTLWNASAYPGRAPDGGAAFTTYIGGRRQPELAGGDDDTLIASVHDELRELMGIEAAPDQVFLRRWERAIPQYVSGHGAVMAQVDALEQAQPGLFVGGNFRGGISVGDCVTRAGETAERLAAHLAG